MILCEWDAPEGDPGQSCVHLFARILSTSFTSVSIFPVCCYSSVSTLSKIFENNFKPARLTPYKTLYFSFLDVKCANWKELHIMP